MKTRSIVTIAAAIGIFSVAGVAFASSHGNMGGDHGSGYHNSMPKNHNMSMGAGMGQGQGMGHGMGKSHGMGMGAGMRGYNALTPEKQELYAKIVTEADKKMAPLSEKMFAKQAELNALYNNSGSDPATVGKVAGELAKMRTQMRDMQKNLSLRLEKEVGIQSMGRGYRMGGHHRGRMMGCPY